MDRPQREVLRRKRAIIADLLDFSALAEKEYMDQGLLTGAMLNEIKLERTEYSRVFKWLELLPACGNAAFDHLAEVLVSRDLTWLANELQADLLCEKGELHIEEYVFREAGVLIHKHFGRSKRVSELDKKEIEKLLADRYQTCKEAYTRQIKEIQEKLNEALKNRWDEEGKMKDLIQKIHAYLRVEHDRLDDSAHAIENALDVVANDPEMRSSTPEHQAEVLNHTLEGVFDILSRELYEKEVHETERKRCIDMLMSELGTEEEKPVFHLDSMLEEILKQHREQLAQAEREADISDKLAKSMEAKFNNLKTETDKLLAAKEEQVLRLEAEIITKAGAIGELQKKVVYMQDDVDRLNEENAKWIKRCDQIERTRRIGYYQGYYDKQYYDVNSRNYRRKPSNLWRMVDWEERSRRSLKEPNTFNRMVVVEDDAISLIDLNESTNKRPTPPNNKRNGALSQSEGVFSNGKSTYKPPVSESRYMQSTQSQRARKGPSTKVTTRDSTKSQ